jgi:hypothetical protein
LEKDTRASAAGDPLCTLVPEKKKKDFYFVAGMVSVRVQVVKPQHSICKAEANLGCGAWCMVHGAWCMVHGAWCMVHGAWRMAHGACRVACGAGRVCGACVARVWRVCGAWRVRSFFCSLDRSIDQSIARCHHAQCTTYFEVRLSFSLRRIFARDSSLSTLRVYYAIM